MNSLFPEPEDETLEYIFITTLENPFEAQILGAALAAEGIAHEIRSFHDTAYDGLFQAQKGWGQVASLKRHTEQILRMLSEIRSESGVIIDPVPDGEPD